MLKIFTPPVFADIDKTRKASIFFKLVWGTVVLITFSNIVDSFMVPEHKIRWAVIMLTFGLFSILLLHLNNIGKYRIASILMVGLTLLLVSVVIWTSGGIHGPVYNFQLVVIGAGILLGWKEGFFVGLIASVLCLTMFIAEHYGFLPQYEISFPPISLWINASINLGIVAFIQYLAIGSLDKAILNTQKEQSKRRETEQTLVLSENRFKALAILSGNMVYEYSVADKTVIWGGAIENVTGYRPEEYENTSIEQWSNMIHPEDKDKTLNIFKTAVINCEAFSTEYRFRNKNGEYRWIEDESYIIKNKKQKPIKLIGVMKDITHRKKMDSQILNSVIETEERERMHFSQELHDGLGPLLSAAKIYTQWIEMPNANIERGEIAKDLEKLLDESLRTVREISFKLSPHILQNFGLQEAIYAYTAKIKETSDLKFEIYCEDLYRFEENSETLVYRVLCECINNTLKHAQAELVKINIITKNETLYTEYQDNGKGFDAPKILRESTGIGLLNMQSRIKSLNGLMSISSAPQKGTNIAFQIKVTKRQS